MIPIFSINNFLNKRIFYLETVEKFKLDSSIKFMRHMKSLLDSTKVYVGSVWTNNPPTFNCGFSRAFAFSEMFSLMRSRMLCGNLRDVVHQKVIVWDSKLLKD